MKDLKRIGRLRKMHEAIIELGDENLYLTWVQLGVPDEPSKEDFEFIASEDELYFETLELYVRLTLQDSKMYELEGD